MSEDNKYIRFDWAIKHMLRDKENFDVLEGLITVLTGQEVKITEILESESNADSDSTKFNRVDIKAKNSKGEIIIVEVQLTRQFHFLQRILFGASKAVAEHITLGEQYDKIKKIYSISILYCDFGKGDDYIYHGKTVFKGLHTGNDLLVTTKELDAVVRVLPEKVFPEYYLIIVNEFDEIPSTPLEEWMDYLKTGRIKEDTQTPGLQEARRKLQYLKMNPAERKAYERHIDNILVESDVLETAIMEGREIGREEGLAIGMEEGLEQGREEGLQQGLQQGREQGLQQGREQEREAMIKKLMSKGLSREEIESLLK